MIKSNGDFIHGCECCGRDDWCASEVTLKFNYGSKHDGETIILSICGDCADRIFERLSNGIIMNGGKIKNEYRKSK